MPWISVQYMYGDIILLSSVSFRMSRWCARLVAGVYWCQPCGINIWSVSRRYNFISGKSDLQIMPWFCLLLNPTSTFKADNNICQRPFLQAIWTSEGSFSLAKLPPQFPNSFLRHFGLLSPTTHQPAETRARPFLTASGEKKYGTLKEWEKTKSLRSLSGSLGLTFSARTSLHILFLLFSPPSAVWNFPYRL